MIDSTYLLGLLKALRHPQGKCSLIDRCYNQHCYYWEETICGVAKGVLDLVSEALCLSPGWAACQPLLALDKPFDPHLGASTFPSIKWKYFLLYI